MWVGTAESTSKGKGEMSHEVLNVYKHELMPVMQAAMAEAMADKTRVPDQKFTRAYGEWGKGRWGALLTGKPRQKALRYMQIES